MTHAHKIFIRSKKEDSAFIYLIFEAQGGWASYSTLPFKSHDPFRDIELSVTDDFLILVRDLLQSLNEIVSILPGDPSKA